VSRLLSGILKFNSVKERTMPLPNPFAGDYRLRLHGVQIGDIRMTDFGKRDFIVITSIQYPDDPPLLVKTKVIDQSTLTIDTFQMPKRDESGGLTGETIHFMDGKLYFGSRGTNRGPGEGPRTPDANFDCIEGRFEVRTGSTVLLDDDWTATRPPA
jgi:hypothetical protein